MTLSKASLGCVRLPLTILFVIKQSAICFLDHLVYNMSENFEKKCSSQIPGAQSALHFASFVQLTIQIPRLFIYHHK